MARRVLRGFIWIPRSQTTKYQITVDGLDVTESAMAGGARWSKAILPEVGEFELRLDNNNGIYTDLFVGGEEVIIYMDFTNGTTKRFVGDVEFIQDKFTDDSGRITTLKGTHILGRLLNPIVSESYDGDTSSSQIVIDLIAKYAADFTTVNVATSTDAPVIAWNGVELSEALTDLSERSGSDLKVDDDKDIHYFQKGTNINTTEAVVWEDNFIELTGYDTDIVEVKNRVRVLGTDDSGLPVIYTDGDTASMQGKRVRERQFQDTKINNFAEAKDKTVSEVAKKKDEDTRGKLVSGILPGIDAGDKMWVKRNPETAAEQFVISKFEHNLPIEETICYLEREFEFKQIMKTRISTERQLEIVTNPNDLDFSFNNSFFASDTVDESASSGDYSFGTKGVFMNTGTTALILTDARTLPANLAKIEVKVSGEALDQVSIQYSTDGSTWTTIIPDSLSTSPTSGRLLRVRVTLNGTTARVAGVALLYSLTSNYQPPEFSSDRPVYNT